MQSRADFNMDGLCFYFMVLETRYTNGVIKSLRYCLLVRLFISLSGLLSTKIALFSKRKIDHL